MVKVQHTLTTLKVNPAKLSRVLMMSITVLINTEQALQKPVNMSTSMVYVDNCVNTIELGVCGNCDVVIESKVSSKSQIFLLLKNFL